MLKSKKRFIQILRIELDDLEDDIDAMLKVSGQRLEQRELTERVYYENLAVFKNELLGLGAFKRILDEFDVEPYESLETMIASLEKRFGEEIIRLDLVPAINTFVNRKINKVARYIQE